MDNNTEMRLKEMLGHTEGEGKPATTSPIPANKPQPRSKSKPKTKSIAVLQRSLQKEWQFLYSELSKISFVSTIYDRNRNEYFIKGCAQNRKTTAKKNIKALSATLRNIEVLLVGCSEAIKATDSIDTVLDTLCFVSREITSFEKLLAKLKALCGYIYQIDPAISEIRNECFEHYVALLQESGRNQSLAKKKISAETKKLAQQHKKLTTDIEKRRVYIANATLALRESIQHQEEIQGNFQKQKPLLARDLAQLNTALAQVNNSIVAFQGSTAINESALANATEQTSVLLAKLQSSRRDKELLAIRDKRKTVTLHEQIADAEVVAQKTVFFKKAKIQRVDELKASLAKHQEEMCQMMAQIEEQIASLQKAYDTQADHAAKLASIQAENGEKLTRLNQEKADLLQKIEDKQTELQELESKATETAAAVAKEREALQKKEQEQEALLYKLGDCVKALECNRRKETAFNNEMMEKLLDYPSNFSHLEMLFASNAISEFAFTRQISDAFNAAVKASAQIAMLEKQRLHMQALQQAVTKLAGEGTISLDNVDQSIDSKLSDIEETLRQLAADTVACQIAFDIADEKTNEKPSTVVVKKARKLFEDFWTLISDGVLVPQNLKATLDGARCLRISDEYYLFFTPFYIVALELKKRSRIEIELVEYSAISMEVVETQIPLDYGQECPDGATIISERWQYETVNGAPNRRYANNQSYYVVALNGVKLVYNGREKISYFRFAEEAEKVMQAFDDFRSFLHNENADIMKVIFNGSQIPDVIRITTEIAESRKIEENARKKQERQLKQRELMLRKQREEEKRQKELHQKQLELWADNAQKKKAEDDLLVTQRQDLLSPITAVELANWDELQSMPVSISDKRRVITTGITKVEFVHKENAVGTTKYLVFFADETGKEFSDVRTLAGSPVGTTSVIPFEIKTQSIANPTILYLLVRDMDNGKLVGKFEYKMNIAFTNDFDF